MRSENTVDTAVAARHERFGRLPDRVPYEDMVEERTSTPRDLASAYDPEGSWLSFSCVAADLGL
ncbi:MULTISPECIES: hypothetical protein [unclassified Streptomyces]|uniref:hypothetical protein n=1 Tax=Streptomyces TaxID=1883 RepID=UPI0001C1A300|nr:MULTISPECIES: hypothetical protein [unclassified Streptomyces]AEN08273.1 conserved hypothetical protein [Streptomyces sp. SirexAA-E]MYR68227.1 hypothetical protein [Streptomyces sp. SID4939]MYS02566.1 hypothetical protein [Streptomyces sp. SID4940]MYT66582.1 hypothetical protein [Streptomyces sp. SID8357]MYT83503.1 hypothetical protein [Streptomyces sp. SID8360]